MDRGGTVCPSSRGATPGILPSSARPITSDMRGPRVEGVEPSRQPGPLCAIARQESVVVAGPGPVRQLGSVARLGRSGSVPAVRTFCTSSRRPGRAARAADAAASPALPPGLPLRRAKRRSAGAKSERSGPPRRTAFTRPQLHSAAGLAPARHCPGRAEPVKSAYGVGYADLRLLTEPARSPGDRSYQEPGEDWARA
jgi:hypothetical protein